MRVILNNSWKYLIFKALTFSMLYIRKCLCCYSEWTSMKNKCKGNHSYWYEILQHRLEHLLEDYKYNSNAFDHLCCAAFAGGLQFWKHTVAVSVLIFVISSMTNYSWDFCLSSHIYQIYFHCILNTFSHLFNSSILLLGQI